MNELTNNQSIGKYQLISKISDGGFGTVYKVRNVENNRIEALKILHSNKAADPNCLRMFQMEATILQANAHPNIVELFDSGVDNGVFYIAMEYLQGMTLAEAIKQGEVGDWDQITNMVSQLVDTLTYLHGRQIIHCDLKPENIMLLPNGHIKVIDFGLARTVHTEVTLPADAVYNMITGTPEYTAPEIWEEKNVSVAVDIYALGCLLFELATKQVLFEADTVSDVILSHFRPVSIPAIWYESAPLHSDHVLFKALECESDLRYTTAEAFFADLNAISRT